MITKRFEEVLKILESYYTSRILTLFIKVVCKNNEGLVCLLE